VIWQLFVVSPPAMPNYDFRVLSPIDFEILTRDLLQAEFRFRLETFKAGADRGIDLRYAGSRRRSIIIQCKHHPTSTFRRLRSHLVRDELPKVRKLKPSRYVFVTSLGLNPAEKDRLVRDFRPFLRTTADIYGRDDLNNLLGRHPKIEKQTFKLWFSSVAVFEEILERKVYNVSRDALERIRQKAKFYVQNPSFNEALTILRKHNFCIITGIPGIGKTTLAEMLILDYIRRKYDFVKVESDISEVRGLDYTTRRRIFYYDDFLGQASFSEKLNKNEDQKLLDFLYAIRRSKVSKMLLTTREYILNQAKLRYEKIDRSKFDVETCVIDLSKYTRLIRAQILFNHVFFSALPLSYKRALLADDRYFDIIDHENYNPRIIELLTDISRLRTIRPRRYASFFLANLDDPFEIWRHAFEHQLSRESRDLLIVLPTLPGEADLEDLQEAFEEFHSQRAVRYHYAIQPGDLRDALKELDGNFVFTNKSDGRTFVRFHNPSTTGSPGFQPVLKANEKLFVAAIQRTISTKGWTERYGFARGEFRLDPLSVEERIAFSCSVASKIDDKKFIDWIRKKIRSLSNRFTQLQANRKDVAYLFHCVSQLDSVSIPKTVLSAAYRFFLTNPERLEHIEAYCQFAELFPQLVRPSGQRLVQANFWRLADEYEYEENPDNVREHATMVESLAGRLEVDADQRLLDMEAHAKKLEKKAEDADEETTTPTPASKQGEEETREIRSLFSTMLVG
jgi:hypothetical protein